MIPPREELMKQIGAMLDQISDGDLLEVFWFLKADLTD